MLAVILCGFGLAASAGAQQAAQPLHNTFGEVGILDMPSAHMAPDGQIAFNIGDIGAIQRYSASFQFLPWLETTFRYSHTAPGVNNWDRSFTAKFRVLKEGDTQPDVSVGFRDLLGTGVYSSEYLAASKHLGPVDLTAGLGWGRLADTGTIPNPLGAIFPSFKNRQPAKVFTAGTIEFKTFFHGAKTGIFGGAAWQTPIDNLKLLVEYSTDKYTYEGSVGGLKVRSPVNVGLSYRPFDFLALSAGWFYGTTYGFTISVNGDPTTSYPSAMRIGPAVPPPAVRTNTQQQSALRVMQSRNARLADLRTGGPWVTVPTPAEQARQDLLQAYLSESRGVRDVGVSGGALMIDAHTEADSEAQCLSYAKIAQANRSPEKTLALTDLDGPSGAVTFCPIETADAADGAPPGDPPDPGDAVERRINADFLAQSLQLDAVSLGTSELWVYYENYRYESEDEAVGRIVRVLMADAPPSIELFHITAVRLGMPLEEMTVARSAVERALSNGVPAAGMSNALSLGAPPLDSAVFREGVSRLYPLFTWSLDPKLTEHVFDPDAPLQFMIYGDATALLQLAPGLMISTELTGTIWSNYTFTRGSGSLLPHVRTDLLEYLKHGKYGISSLQLVYRRRLARDVFAEFHAGYLEDMFMGEGSQILWRPQDSRIAVGADLYNVWQREFDRLFGIRNYHVLTGHVSVYYDSPWYGLNFAVHAGRYLAGDYGGTFEVTRRFASGVEIGAWATFTNVPFSKFGEGSFDKGIIIHIPLEWGLPIFSQSAYHLDLHSLTRDGGQRLANDDSLYDETRRESYGELVEHLNDVVEP